MYGNVMYREPRVVCPMAILSITKVSDELVVSTCQQLACRNTRQSFSWKRDKLLHHKRHLSHPSIRS